MAKTASLTQPLKWHGGKHYLASRIVSFFPRHLHYCEPYFGGGAVLLARNPDDERLWWGTKSHERGVSEVVNDINGALMNFWNVLRGQATFEKFHRHIEAIPFAEEAWERCCPNESYKGAVSRAVAFFVCCRQSLAGRMDSFAPLSKTRTRRGINEQASAWLSAIEGLPAVHERLKSVVILNQHALEVIRKQDGEKTLFYCDPPYLPETRAATDVYKHEMTRQDHWDLCNHLAVIEGKFILSGYDNEVYQGFAHDYGWRRADFDLPNNAASGEVKRRMTECVWMNY